MNIHPQTYSELNGAQCRDARELLERIREDEIHSAPIILDVGCGCGNVTGMLARAIQHERFLSFDFDLAMVEFASKNNSFSTIEFFVQDISVPWEEINTTLQELEGQVDLVWSNEVLQWVPAQLQPLAVLNMLRFLKPGGCCYVNTKLIRDINEFAPEEQIKSNEKLLKIPGITEQLDSWRNAFIQAGLTDVNISYKQNWWSYESKEEFHQIQNLIHINSGYLTDNVPKDQESAVLESFQDLYVRCLATPFGQPLVESAEEAVTEYYGIFQITGTK